MNHGRGLPVRADEMAETQVSASALSGSGRDGMLRGASRSGGPAQREQPHARG